MENTKHFNESYILAANENFNYKNKIKNLNMLDKKKSFLKTLLEAQKYLL